MRPHRCATPRFKSHLPLMVISVISQENSSEIGPRWVIGHRLPCFALPAPRFTASRSVRTCPDLGGSPQSSVLSPPRSVLSPQSFPAPRSPLPAHCFLASCFLPEYRMIYGRLAFQELFRMESDPEREENSASGFDGCEG